MNTRESVIRTFIAIDVPLDLKKGIGRIQTELIKLGGGRISWVKPEGIHLTLKFLGDVTRDEMKEVVESVRKTVSKHDDFVLRTTVKGGFPRLSQPRTLWVGVDGGDVLMELHKDLEVYLTTAGFGPEDAKFHPHLTVCRVKEIDKGAILPAKFADYPLESFEWMAGSVNVMMSRLSPSGADYKCIEAIKLGVPGL